MNQNRLVFLCTTLLLLFCAAVPGQNIATTSPDGDLKFEMTVDTKSNRIKYEITYQGNQVILPSELGITGFSNNIETIEQTGIKSVDTLWRTVYGERATVRDHYNQCTVAVKAKGQKDRLNIIVRAFNEGIAFRYIYTGYNTNMRIEDEYTTFGVPENTECWFAPYAQAEHVRMAVEKWPSEAERPLTLKLGNGLYAALCEAEVVDYCRTKFFVKDDEKNLIRCKMYDSVEEYAPYETPWRVVMVAKKPTELLANNDIILNLNEPCKIEDISWIKPGKIMRVTQLSTQAAKDVIDFAAERAIEYIHFDAGWYGPEILKSSDPRRCAIRGLDMSEVVKYAKSKGIGVWLYVNQRALTEYLDEILPLYQSWGIKGIKFGFVHVGSYRWTSWMHEAVRRCAQYNLMVDIHDEYRPTGFSRTYPNLLTQEGVRGNEEFPDGVVNTTQPFTRFLSGAADYTICYFHRPELKPELIPRGRFLKNTPVHQMALSVINYSPLQFLYWYDSPKDAQNEPELDFFNALPTVWDDTRIVSGQIGEQITVARKKDGIWFIGAITNNDARTMEIDMSFLEPGKKYTATIYTDGGEEVKTRTHVAIDTKSITSKNVLKQKVASRGGIAIIVREK